MDGLRATTATIVGAVGTSTAVLLREIAQDVGLYLSVACGLCTFIIILPKTVRTVKGFLSSP